ncbi:MAG: hypothetical protein JWM27_1329 [Gemmatimonadetes bacterium]|nr:hypothetical protein [Gemmatimonadota bacterium]
MSSADEAGLITRMEAALAGLRSERATIEQTLAALRERENVLKVSIETARGFLHSTPDSPADVVETEAAKGPWGGVSIRTAAIQVLGRTPGHAHSVHEIAETLLGEGYPYIQSIVRFRETISVVLKQHMDSGKEPFLEKPMPARYVLPQTELDTLSPLGGEE